MEMKNMDMGAMMPASENLWSSLDKWKNQPGTQCFLLYIHYYNRRWGWRNSESTEEGWPMYEVIIIVFRGHQDNYPRTDTADRSTEMFQDIVWGVRIVCTRRMDRPLYDLVDLTTLA